MIVICTMFKYKMVTAPLYLSLTFINIKVCFMVLLPQSGQATLNYQTVVVCCNLLLLFLTSRLDNDLVDAWHMRKSYQRKENYCRQSSFLFRSCQRGNARWMIDRLTDQKMMKNKRKLLYPVIYYDYISIRHVRMRTRPDTRPWLDNYQ